jgi:hypothetical protein
MQNTSSSRRLAVSVMEEAVEALIGAGPSLTSHRPARVLELLWEGHGSLDPVRILPSLVPGPESVAGLSEVGPRADLDEAQLLDVLAA